jgi:hypothetical protein
MAEFASARADFFGNLRPGRVVTGTGKGQVAAKLTKFLLVCAGGVPVWVLIDHGADLNAQDHHGATPLHMTAWAAWMNNPAYRKHSDLAHLLIEQGAEINLQDKDGRTPLYLATRLADEKFKDLLERHGAVDCSVVPAVTRGDLSMVEALVDRGCDIRFRRIQ